MVGCNGRHPNGETAPQKAPAAKTGSSPLVEGEEHQLLVENHWPARVGLFDWNQWRGGARDGATNEIAWRDNWTEEPPVVIWRKLVGAGYSGVVVRDGFAYTSGNAEGKDTVWCFDAETGQVIWTFSYPCRQGDYPGPRATPAVLGERLWTLSLEGQFFCLNASTGKPVW
jgi:outer membrane protein assembly factor BamB